MVGMGSIFEWVGFVAVIVIVNCNGGEFEWVKIWLISEARQKWLRSFGWLFVY